MEWKDHLITTSVDRLLEYLAEHRSASVAEAAEDLDVSEEMIEVWASALTDADMVEKTYSARRGTVLTVADTKKAREKMEEVRQETQEEMEEASEEIEGEHEELEEAKETLRSLTKDLEARVEADQQLEEDISALKEEEEQLDDSGDDRHQEMLDLLHEIDSSLASVDQLEEELEGFRQRRDAIEANLKALKKMEDHIDTIEEDDRFTCDECGRGFDTEKGLKIHRSQKHKRSDSFLGRIRDRLSVRRKGE